MLFLLWMRVKSFSTRKINRSNLFKGMEEVKITSKSQYVFPALQVTSRAMMEK